MICRFGAYLVQEELAQAGDVLTVFFAILIGAFVIGQAGPNLQKLVQAQAAAGAVYQVIDRVSPCQLHVSTRSCGTQIGLHGDVIIVGTIVI